MVYTDTLRRHGVRVSMTESGEHKDNAQSECINNTIKNELLKGNVFGSIDEVIAAVAVAVDFYNNRRPHMSIGMMTPSEASRLSGARNMIWASRRLMALKNRHSHNIPELPLPKHPCQGFSGGRRPEGGP